MMSDEWKPSLSKPNVVCDKSYTFALNIVSLARTLRKQGEYEIASQVLRSGTSIGANIEEAQSGVSRADFAAKIGIASKEARETHYWLRLIRDTQLSQQDNIAPRIQEVSELLRLLTAKERSSSSSPKIEHWTFTIEN